MKRICAAFLAVMLSATIASECQGQYTTDWIANTFGTNVTHVGNAARSMWVAPEGTIYTASMWDENEGGIAIYKSGLNAGSLGAHGEPQGSAITGNATKLWAPRQWGRVNGVYSSGLVIRYDRVTGAFDQNIQVSCDTTERRADVITGIATWSHFWMASDNPCARMRLYDINGTWLRDIAVTDPGALAFDRNGNILVAQEAEGTVLQVSQTGTILHTLTLPAGEVPHALYFDPTTQYLWIGDAGPDQNAKIYDTRTWTLKSTFGVKGGYLDTTTGTKGQVGSLRFARIDGIGKDSAGNLYILSQPWGGSWDHGRTGGTDLYAYSPTGKLLYNLRALNFEAIAAPDPATDATLFYSGVNIYSGTGSADWKFVANTVDPFTYPSDPRLDVTYRGRGLHFGMIASAGTNRVLVATDQNPDGFYFFHFDAAQGYTAVPDGVLPGTLFNATALVRNGFCLDSRGDVWAGLDKTNRIWHWPLTGFDANGKPSWGAPVTVPVPASIGDLSRIIYLPESDTMILGQRITGSTDWTGIGTRVEVYHGWLAGNTTNPNPVITLTSANPKSLTAAGNYLFVGYVHTVPNIDAFNLTTGRLDNTFINSNPSNVYVGNDVDSMYGLRSYLRSTGEYVVTKDNYNGSSIVVYRWTP
ncbi:YncE family protein [Paraburkholderia elongata]|nr:SMP-30/gluconolaconase/LRE-like region family protein [Paraburkholderia elongata]